MIKDCSGRDAVLVCDGTLAANKRVHYPGGVFVGKSFVVHFCKGAGCSCAPQSQVPKASHFLSQGQMLCNLCSVETWQPEILLQVRNCWCVADQPPPVRSLPLSRLLLAVQGVSIK